MHDTQVRAASAVSIQRHAHNRVDKKEASETRHKNEFGPAANLPPCTDTCLGETPRRVYR